MTGIYRIGSARLIGRASLSAIAALAALTVAAAPAGAQAYTYTAAGGEYALLNGSNLALYVDLYGDLGAPQNLTAPTKPGGTLNGSGQPYVNADGSVNTLGGTNLYAALYNPVAQSGALQQQVQNKTEYISLGARDAVEGWSVSVNGGASFVPCNGLGMTATPISVAYNSTTGQLSAVTNTTLSSGATDLLISQQVLFNTPGQASVAQFVVTLTNNGASAITGLQYARAVDPNQGVAPPGSSGDVNTNQSFGSPSSSTQFAINSADQEGFNRNLSLGVNPADLNSPGSTIYAVSGNQTQQSVLTNPLPSSQNNPNQIVLHTSDLGADFVDPGNPSLDATTANYKLYLASPALAPFLNSQSQSVTPAFSTYSDTDLVLLSPSMNLAAGESTTFTFYYSFSASTVPAPGSAPIMLAGAAGFGCTLRRRRRTPAAHAPGGVV